MAETKTKAKSGVGGGVIVLLLVAALALSHAKIAPPGVGGGGGGHRPTARYLPDDPCPEGSHPEHVIRSWSGTIGGKPPSGPTERKFAAALDCQGWRDITEQIYLDGTKPPPASRNVLDCISTIITRVQGAITEGVHVRSVAWVFARAAGGEGSVVADLDSGYVTSAHLTNMTWAECAAA